MKSQKHACINAEGSQDQNTPKAKIYRTYSKLHRRYEITWTHVPKSKTGKGRFKHGIKPKFTGHHKLLRQYKLHKFTCAQPRGKQRKGKDQAHRKTKIYRAQHVQQNSSSNITLYKLACTTSTGKEEGGKVQARHKTEISRGTARTTNFSNNMILHKLTCTNSRGKKGRGNVQARRQTEITGAAAIFGAGCTCGWSTSGRWSCTFWFRCWISASASL